MVILAEIGLSANFLAGTLFFARKIQNSSEFSRAAEAKFSFGKIKSHMCCFHAKAIHVLILGGFRPKNAPCRDILAGTGPSGSVHEFSSFWPK